MGFVAVGFGGGEQAHDRGGPMAGRFGTGEQPVFSAQGDWPDCVLDRVVVDRIMSVLENARQRWPTPQGVVDGVERAAGTEDVFSLRIEPEFERDQ